MLDGLFIASLIGTAVQAFKETFAPTVPAENWANKELYHQDMMNGVPIEQRMKNLENGKYKLDGNNVKKYPEPHRNPVNGKIVIENYKLYKEDMRKYGTIQPQRWAEQGKYNLTSEELKKEREYIKKRREYVYSLL